MVIFIFDAGKIDSGFYGHDVIEKIVADREVVSNSHKIIFSFGDILDRGIHADITPYIINDEICTIKRNEKYKGDLFGVMLEDIEMKYAVEIDMRLKLEYQAYIGMTSVDIQSTDVRKQFWKVFVRSFSIEAEVITIFGSEEEGCFLCAETMGELGFTMTYDELPCDFLMEFAEGKRNLFSTRQSTFVQSLKQLEKVSGKSDSDRGILEMNFSLVKEVGVAGVMIWKAIEDIDLTQIPSPNAKSLFGHLQSDWTVTDYVFTSLYQASQGIERLLKIAIQLIWYDKQNNDEKQAVEKLLLSHNHLAMTDFIEKKENFRLRQSCKGFMAALYDFYKYARYNRFSFSRDDRLELTMIQNLGKDIDDDDFDKKIKHRYGRLLGKTSQSLFELIKDLAYRLNIYVYELNHDSVARYAFYSYFGSDLYEVLKRIEKAKRELIWYLMSTGVESKLNKSNEVHPLLEFGENYSRKDLIDSLINGSNDNMLYDFIDYEYGELAGEDKESWKKRLDFVDLITNKYEYYFCDDDGFDYSDD